MSEVDPFADPPTTYFFESLLPIYLAEHGGAEIIGMYLLDLVAVQGYRTVSGVRYEVVEPADGMPPHPAGWCYLRALVDVQEFDVEVQPDDGIPRECACNRLLEPHQWRPGCDA